MILSIVIVNFNAREHLVNCVQSLVRGRPAIEHEVIVVDNASSDDSAAAIAVSFPWVKLVRLPSNAGFAAGNNVH